MKKISLLACCLLFFVACKKENSTDNANSNDSIASVAEETTTSGYKIGDVATDFALKGVDDKFYSLKDFVDAKGYIVIFTCNHCPYAKAYEDRIVALDKKY